MLQKPWWILFIVFSLFGCKNGPQLSYCAMDAPNQVLRCSDPKQNAFTLTIAQADNYGCMSPDDWQTLLTWLKTEGKAQINTQAVMSTLEGNSQVGGRFLSRLRR